MSCLGSAQTLFQFCSQDRDVRLLKHRIAISGHQPQMYVCCVHPVQVRMRIELEPERYRSAEKNCHFPRVRFGAVLFSSLKIQLRYVLKQTRGARKSMPEHLISSSPQQ